jgi:hypothetical protein
MRGKDMVEVTKEAVAAGAAERIEADREADLAACDELIENIRRRVRPEAVHDPASYYFQRPDLLKDAQEAAERNIADMKARHGLVARVVTPEERAQADFEERWPESDALPEGFIAMIDRRQAMLEAEPAWRREQRQREIVEGLGVHEYNALLAEARKGVTPGEKLPAVFETDETVLRMLATRARYNAAREAADPSRRRAAAA